jgi:hypothetical protein
VKRLEGRLLQSPGQGELVALLDLGSNASRFLVARVAPGVGFEVLRKERVQTRLGEGPAGRLRRAAIEKSGPRRRTRISGSPASM